MVSSQFDKVAHGRLTQRGNPWYGRQLLRATPPKNGAIFDKFFLPLARLNRQQRRCELKRGVFSFLTW